MENTIDRILNRIENVVEDQLKKFEEQPAKTGIKLLIFFMLFKFLWRKLTGNK